MTEFSQYLSSVKVRLGMRSERELALKLGISTTSIYNIIKGSSIPDDDKCLKIAEISGDDADKILLLAHKCKASDKSRPIWDGLLKKVANMTVPALVLAIPSYQAIELTNSLIYYVKLL